MNTLGQPVRWCVTDKEDYDVIKLFLEKINHDPQNFMYQ